MVEFGYEESEEELISLSEGVTAIFTDGSKLEGRVGAAISIWTNGEETKHRLLPLASYCSVFQAELVGIQEAIHIVLKDQKFGSVRIFSDSRSALKSLRDPCMLHPLVVKGK